MSKAPHFAQVLDYARRTAADETVCELTRLSCQRFLDDLENPAYDFSPACPEFCIEIIQGLFCFQKGERIDGTPLRGEPFELMEWHLFCTYAICGFFWKGTNLRRFTEADIFCPRKTVKTTFMEALQFALALWYRQSGPKVITVSGSLNQGMEGFEFLQYNFTRLGLAAKNNPPQCPLKMTNSSMGHCFKGEIWGGYIELNTYAYDPDRFDSFNAQFVHLDELQVYRNSIPYTRLRGAMKGFSNKLLSITFTAGELFNGFAKRQHDDIENILRGTVTGIDADRTFVFMAEAPELEDGSVDYTNPAVHKAANPAYGITIRPNDMMAEALQAERNPELRLEFFTRSLNKFVSSFRAWFDVDEFIRSDGHYNWTQAEVMRLVRDWYGGADLSKLHDLTAACLVGEIPAKAAATADWTPPEDVLVIVPHCWFPVTAAEEKAYQDKIPLFGWKDEGWLDMPNTASMDPTEPVKQFEAWRKAGFHIRKVGHDRKFARNYYTAMKKAGFSVADQPQLAVVKSEGLRYIEHKAKIGCLYYCHAEPYEYCVSNVKGCEKADDIVQYEKISDTSRIDVFDASVFATIRMLIDTERSSSAVKWFDNVPNSGTGKED